MNKYIVIELQTADTGQVSTLTTVYDTQFQAESAFHGILAAAALSDLPKHGAIIITGDGEYMDAKTYEHSAE